MSWLKAMVVSRKGRVVVAIVLAYILFQGWLWIAAPGKITGAFPAERQRVNILVTLRFPPERFHVQVFQGFGRVSGTQDNSIEVRNVRKTDLDAVARPYWVAKVEPLKEGG
jgi:hypothetical protein